MTRAGMAVLAFAVVASLGTTCGGKSVVLWTATPVVALNEEVIVLVESRNYLPSGFAFRVTYPAPNLPPAGGGRLELVGNADLAHGPADVAIMPSSQAPGAVVVYAADAVDNPSPSASLSIVLAALRFRAVGTGSAVLQVQSAKLGSIGAANPAWAPDRVNPALGAPLTIQVNP